MWNTVNVQNMQPVQKECKEEFKNHSKLHVDFVLIGEEENVISVVIRLVWGKIIGSCWATKKLYGKSYIFTHASVLYTYMFIGQSSEWEQNPWILIISSLLWLGIWLFQYTMSRWLILIKRVACSYILWSCSWSSSLCSLSFLQIFLGVLEYCQ